MTKPSSKLSKTTALEQNQKAIEGVDKYLAHTKTLVVAGTSYTPASLKAVLQAEIDGNKSVDSDRAQYKQQVVAARQARAKGRAVRKGLKGYLLTNFGSDAVQTFEDFGFTPPKTPVRTAKSKAQAVDKAVATREAKKEAIATHVATPPTPPAPAAVTTTPAKQ
jgi:hypothetical protein